MSNESINGERLGTYERYETSSVSFQKLSHNQLLPIIFKYIIIQPDYSVGTI